MFFYFFFFCSDQEIYCKLWWTCVVEKKALLFPAFELCNNEQQKHIALLVTQIGIGIFIVINVSPAWFNWNCVINPYRILSYCLLSILFFVLKLLCYCSLYHIFCIITTKRNSSPVQKFVVYTIYQWRCNSLCTKCLPTRPSCYGLWSMVRFMRTLWGHPFS